MTFIDWTIIALFLGALIVIGYLFSKKNKNIEDYFMAGPEHRTPVLRGRLPQAFQFRQSILP